MKMSAWLTGKYTEANVSIGFYKLGKFESSYQNLIKIIKQLTSEETKFSADFAPKEAEKLSTRTFGIISYILKEINVPLEQFKKYSQQIIDVLPEKLKSKVAVLNDLPIKVTDEDVKSATIVADGKSRKSRKSRKSHKSHDDKKRKRSKSRSKRRRSRKMH